MFHSRQFHGSVMSPFFGPHKPFDDVTLDNVRPPFHPQRYPTDRESNSDTRLTPMYSMDSNPLKSTYPTNSVEPDPLDLFYPSVIRLSFDSSASSTADWAPPSVHRHRFICTYVVPCGHGRARGRGCGDDAPGGFRNKYLPFDK